MDLDVTYLEDFLLKVATGIVAQVGDLLHQELGAFCLTCDRTNKQTTNVYSQSISQVR